MTREIPLTQGFVALVDDEDFEELARYRWHAQRCRRIRGNDDFNAVRMEPTGLPPRWSRQRMVLMHRAVIGAPAGVGVDHKNGNGLDNRRSNLRLANDTDNQANRHQLVQNTSGYRGVTFHKQNNRWQAGLKKNGRSHYLGVFSSAVEAAIAYDAKAREVFGEFARPNFPEYFPRKAA